MLEYDKLLSDTVVRMEKSGIRKYFDLLETMGDVVGLTVGQPDFVTPWHIREAGIESLEKGKTYYTSNAGTMDLRVEIDKYLTRRFDISYDPTSEIIVTVGGSEAIDIAIRAIVSAGDEVIIPDEDVPADDTPDEIEDLEEPDVPLADVPKTGDSALWVMLAVLSALGLGVITVSERKRREI